jgi:signal transduction histidine kinase
MSVRTSRRITNGVIALCALFVASSFAFQFDGRAVEGIGSGDWIFVVGSTLGGAVYLGIGRAIVVRHPTNTIGWLLLAVPTIGYLAIVNGDYATHTLAIDPGSLPFGRVSAWLDRWLLVPALAAFIPVFLLYPDGRLPSRRWRLVGIVTFGAPVLTAAAFALTPGVLVGAMADLAGMSVVNPLGIQSAAGLIDALTQVGAGLMLLSAIAAVASIVVRYRRADSEVRQQIRWLAFVGIAFFVVLAVAIALDAGGLSEDSPLGDVLFVLLFFIAVLGIPVACGIAILRYRLYELDVVVRKTVVFATLAAFIGLVYAAIVGGAGALVGARGDATLSFVAAAALAILFQPARDRARRLADRLVYGHRATPYEVLSEFSERAGGAYSSEDVLPRMAEIVGRGVAAERATVWLRVGGELRPEATWPAGGLGPAVALVGDELPELGEHAVDVRHRGELLGAIGVTMPPSEPLDPAKDRLIRDLAAQAGLVLRNTRLVEELRASRKRLVAAQDEERRKLERNLHDGAQQHLVALQVQLGLAEQLAGTAPDRERQLIHHLQGAAATALDELRDLARGIYPPLLADRGLAAALEAQARRSAVPVTVEPNGVGRYGHDVEAAVYFCALEALQNVAKYADASRARIAVSASDGHLRFRVEDDGKGFDASSTRLGTGLQGMIDRLEAVGGSIEVRTAPGSGTTISGRVPIRGGASS